MQLHPTERAIFDQLPAAVGERIQFLDYLEDAELSVLYQGATLLIFPSLGEGFGYPSLEAVACGTHMVTTRDGSIPEVTGNAAQFVDGFDHKSIAHGILEVVRDEKLIKHGLARANSIS